MTDLLWIALGLFVLFDIVIVVLVVLKRGGRKPDAALLKTVRNAWMIVSEKAERDPGSAVIEADKLFLHALDRLGYRGDTVAKMRAVQSRLGNKQAVWEAHKLRNRIAHEVGLTVSPFDAQTALRAFERALHDLKLLS